MGEICKGPQNEPQAVKIESSTEILVFLIRAEGAASVLRKFQYALEEIAGEAFRLTPGLDKDTAAKYLRAAEAIEEPYNALKNEIKI